MKRSGVSIKENTIRLHVGAKIDDYIYYCPWGAKKNIDPWNQSIINQEVTLSISLLCRISFFPTPLGRCRPSHQHPSNILLPKAEPGETVPSVSSPAWHLISD